MCSSCACLYTQPARAPHTKGTLNYLVKAALRIALCWKSLFKCVNLRKFPKSCLYPDHLTGNFVSIKFAVQVRKKKSQPSLSHTPLTLWRQNRKQEVEVSLSPSSSWVMLNRNGSFLLQLYSHPWQKHNHHRKSFKSWVVVISGTRILQGSHWGSWNICDYHSFQDVTM